MASPYLKGCFELTAGLQQNENALKMLQNIYKLPTEYGTLPASATVNAIELLGIMSDDNPTGLLDLPLVLGMKANHKRIKNKLKGKVKYTGFSGIVKTQPRKDLIQNNIEDTFCLLKGQLKLMEIAMECSEEESGLGEVLDDLETVKQFIDDFLHRVPRLHSKVLNPHTTVAPQIHRQQHIRLKIPAHKMPVPAPLPHKKDEDRSFDKIPTPTNEKKGMVFPSSQTSNDDNYEPQETWLPLLSDTKKSSRLLPSAPSEERGRLAWKDLQKEKSSSPGPPTMPKPTKQKPRAMPLLPPIRKTPLPLPPATQSNGSDSERNSGYILMSPPNTVIKGQRPLSDYVNIGPSKAHQFNTTGTNDEEYDNDSSDDDFEEYETVNPMKHNNY